MLGPVRQAKFHIAGIWGSSAQRNHQKQKVTEFANSVIVQWAYSDLFLPHEAAMLPQSWGS